MSDQQPNAVETFTISPFSGMLLITGAALAILGFAAMPWINLLGVAETGLDLASLSTCGDLACTSPTLLQRLSFWFVPLVAVLSVLEGLAILSGRKRKKPTAGNFIASIVFVYPFVWFYIDMADTPLNIGKSLIGLGFYIALVGYVAIIAGFAYSAFSSSDSA